MICGRGCEVGYGKPPQQHRFRKGDSGNPKEGARNKRPRLNEERVKTIIPQEAWRMNTDRNGDRPVNDVAHFDPLTALCVGMNVDAPSPRCPASARSFRGGPWLWARVAGAVPSAKARSGWQRCRIRGLGL